MEPEVRKAPVRFYEIDMLRFLAALSVVFYHWTYRSSRDDFSPISYAELGEVGRYGYLGVELFFIISGYVVLMSAQGKTVRQFFLSRVTRLYPAFWAACTLTALVKVIWSSGLASPYLHVSAKQYVYNLSMLHEFFGVAAVDAVYWSLTQEIVFYFLIAVLIGFGLMRHLTLFIALWLGYTALVGPAASEGSTRFALLFFPQFSALFAAGMLFYLIQQPEGRSWQRYALLAFAFLLAIRSALYRAINQSIELQGVTSPKVAAAIVALFFAIFLLIAFRKISLSNSAWLAKLGALTYPLYLIHSDIAFIFFHRVGYQYNKYLVLIGTLVVMLVIAYLINRLVEKPFHKPLGAQVNRLLASLESR
jgi:peptidoglycan/LPS O-acetylase OafA/YrhL